MVIAKVSKERFTLQNEQQEPLKIKSILNSLSGNKYALITLAYIFALNLTNAVRSTIGIYYYKYYFHDANMLALVGGITIVPTLVGSFLSPVINKRLGLKLNIVSAVGATILTSIPMYFLPPLNGALCT